MVSQVSRVAMETRDPQVLPVHPVTLVCQVFKDSEVTQVPLADLANAERE